MKETESRIVTTRNLWPSNVSYRSRDCRDRCLGQPLNVAIQSRTGSVNDQPKSQPLKTRQKWRRV